MLNKLTRVAPVACTGSAGSGRADGSRDHALDNGMKVIVKPDHRAPVVVSQVWYRVGSSYEPDGLTGISHVLEHMMFKGTEALGPGEFSRTISELGGNENAFTGRDYTAYFETLAVEHLETALETRGRSNANLVLDNEEFLKEIEVVKEERRLRTDDRPSGKTFEQFSAVAWRSSPYRNPVIGWMNDLEHMTVAISRTGTTGITRRTTPSSWWSATWNLPRWSPWPSAISGPCRPQRSSR
jgi:zinc protease